MTPKLIHIEAVQQARVLGLGDNAIECYEVMLRMLRHAARITHEQGSYRYGAYVFNIQGDEVVGVSTLVPWNQICRDCHGTERQQQGEVSVPCQSCASGRLTNDIKIA